MKWHPHIKATGFAPILRCIQHPCHDASIGAHRCSAPFFASQYDLTAAAENPTDIRTFAGWRRDEDPDLIYQEQEGRWLLAICRLDPDTHRYVYVFFESQDPLDGFTFVGKAFPGDETGGCFVRMDGQLYFACGNDFNATSDYRLYSKQGMTQARFVFPDGGFRGWGGVMPLHLGSRHRCFWLTFDRHNGSDYNWSYGNLYVFELLEQRHED